MSDIAAIPPNCIAANPDIAGVGIRVTIYLQNIFCLLVASWAVAHREIPQTGFRLLHAQATGVILTTGTLFLSAFIQAQHYGLSAYHAIIVLNLGWVNLGGNLLYTNIVIFHRFLNSKLPTDNKNLSEAFKSALDFSSGDPYSIPGTSSRFNTISSFWMHISMGLFSGFGLWFWATVDTFSSTSQCGPGLPIPILYSVIHI